MLPKTNTDCLFALSQVKQHWWVLRNHYLGEVRRLIEKDIHQPGVGINPEDRTRRQILIEIFGFEDEFYGSPTNIVIELESWYEAKRQEERVQGEENQEENPNA